MSKMYKVVIQRSYDRELQIYAESEEEALEMANDDFDGLNINGNEMYASNEEVEEAEDE